MPPDDDRAWRCAECGVEKRATAHQMRQTYCSRDCVSAAYKRRLVGSENPNYRAAGQKACQECGVEFISYQKNRKFCGSACYNKSRYVPPKPKVVRQPAKGYVKKGRPPSTLVKGTCLHCGDPFSYYPSAKRKYCSYKCHVDSGGGLRAGEASTRARLRYGAKKDANHAEVMQAIKAITAVYDLSIAGFGVPDGLAWINDGWRLFDIKNPKTAYGRRGLNKRQQKWASDWRGGPVYLIYTVEEAIRFARGELDGIKKFPDASA